MTTLRSHLRIAVVFLALAVVTSAAVPAGWIALRHVPAQGEVSGYWILVKEPEDGLAAWWSDEELAKIAANDPDYVKHLETDWNAESHPVAEADEAERLVEELARYWGGDLPQANYWAHGALTRRGSTLRAFRWERDGLTQRSELERDGHRPGIPAAAIDPVPVDQRYGNRSDIVTHGDRWGSHLRAGTLDHVHTAETNKAKRRHHPNTPPAGEVARKARETVEACRQASLEAEKGVFENYVRGWGGLGAKSVTFGLPSNCVADPGAPPRQRQVVQLNLPPVEPPRQEVTPRPRPRPNPPRREVNPDPPRRRTVTPRQPRQDPPRRRTRRPSQREREWAREREEAQRRLARQRERARERARQREQARQREREREQARQRRRYTACDGTLHDSQRAANRINCDPPPPPPPPEPVKYPACDGSLHDTQRAANRINCDPPPTRRRTQRRYTACDGTTHWSQADADAIECRAEETDELCSLFPFSAGCDQ